MPKVPVILENNSYDIEIGCDLADSLRSYISQAGFSHKVLIIADTNTAPLYGQKIKDLLSQAGLSPVIYIVPAGESSKSLEQAEKIYTKAIEYGLDRHSAIFALGGGVIGDLAGFIAATYMRGIFFVQLPTSLLAQVDSSVGGKVAINHALGKNLIGAFYQPQKVFIDLNLLATLPRREIYTGLGEIVKYGIIYDEDFFTFLERHTQEILKLDLNTIQYIVNRSCSIKAKVVSLDEKESGLRMILNFGHTVGHAIEKETGYRKYNHGEAVAIGMVCASYIAKEIGLLAEADVIRIKTVLRNLHLPVQAESCTAKGVYEDIFHDKKTIDGQVNWVLPEKIGQVKIWSDVSQTVIECCIEKCLV